MPERSYSFTPVDFSLPTKQYEVQVFLSEGIEGGIDYAYFAFLALWAMTETRVAEPSELSLSFVDSALIRVMNRDYRGLDKATDVLSFSTGFDEGEPSAADQPLVLGDVMICPEVADRISYSGDYSLQQKIEILVIHGILHLLGHDHQSEAEAAVMEGREDALLYSWTSWAASRIGQQTQKGDRLMSGALSEPRPYDDQAFGDQPYDNRAILERSCDDQSYDAQSHGAQPYDNQPHGAPPPSAITGKRGGFIQSLRWAIEGIIMVITDERNMRIHLAAALAAMLIGFILGLDVGQWVVIVICIALVLAAEMLNTAIEHLVDMISPEYDSHAKAAKDIAAGVVLVFAVASVIVGSMVFIKAAFTRFLE